MADTSFAFGDPRARTIWSARMFNDALEQIRFKTLMGRTKDDVILVDQDLTRKQGGTVVLECVDELSGAGVGDDGDTTSNAQQITLKNQSVVVHERATRTQSAGAMSMQLTSVNTEKFRQLSKQQLSRLLAQWMENDIRAALTGECNENVSSSDIETVNEVYPESTRIMYLGQTVDSSPTLDNSGTDYGTDALLSAETVASNLFGTLVIKKIKMKMVMASPRFETAKYYQVSNRQERSTAFDLVQGNQGPLIGEFFHCFASPYQLDAMKAELGANGWALTQQALAVRGNDNPVFTGGASLFDGVIIHEYPRIPTRTGAGGTTLAEGFLLNAGRTATTDAVASGVTVARALFLGANAGLFAWAMPFGWWEDMYDANKPIVKTDGIYGTKVNQWNESGGTTNKAAVSRFCCDTCVQT